MKSFLATFLSLFLFIPLGYAKYDTSAIFRKGDSLLQETPQKAFEYYHTFYQKNKEELDTTTLARILGKLGRVSVLLGEYPQAIGFLKTSASYFDQLENPRQRAMQLSRLGDAFYFSKISDPEIALNYYRKARELYDSLGMDIIANLNFNYTGYIYWYRGDKDSALSIHQEALQRFEELNDRRGIAISSSDIGFTYNSIGNYKEALKYNKHAMKLASELGDTLILIPILNNLGISYRNLGFLDSSINYSNQSLQYAAANDLKPRMTEALESLHRAYQDKGDFKNAYLTHLQYKAVKDDINRKEQVKAVLTLEDKLTATEVTHQKEVELLSERNAKNMAYLGLAFLVIVIVLLVIYLRLKARINRILKQKNQIISNQLYEKNILIREVHHRVKNHLQMLRSLNNILYQSPKNKEMSRIIDEINSRVFTISEIHDQLNIAGGKELNFRRYLSSLTQNLINSFDTRVEIVENIEIEKFGMKSSMLLGIIITEFITNSFKYAFEEVEQPKLKISALKKGDKVEIEIADNGGKLNQDILSTEMESQGIEVIKLICEQLNATLEYKKQGEWNGFLIRL